MTGDALETFRPKSAHFKVALQIAVASTDFAGEELFDLDVCDPQTHARLVAENNGVPPHALVRVERFDPREISATLSKLVTDIEGNDWNAIVQELRQFMRWEFEGYNKSPQKH